MQLGDLPFAVAIVLVAALAAVGVAASVEVGAGAYWAGGIVPAAVVALVYLVGYQKRLPPETKPIPEDADDFDDPVAEADLLETAGVVPGGPTAAKVEPDPSGETAPVPGTSTDGPGH